MRLIDADSLLKRIDKLKDTMLYSEEISSQVEYGICLVQKLINEQETVSISKKEYSKLKEIWDNDI